MGPHTLRSLPLRCLKCDKTHRASLAGSFLLPVFLAAGFSLGMGANAELKPAEYSIEESVAAVTDRVTSIDSLKCEYTVRYSNSSKTPTPKRFARSGSKWHYAELSFDSDNGEMVENINSYDGEFVYAYVVRRSKDGVTKWKAVHLLDRIPERAVDPDYLLGAKLSNVSRSVADALETCENLTESTETLADGTLGVRLVSAGVATARPEVGGKFDIAIILDPGHDFLPRQIRITRPASETPPSDWLQQWTIREYHRVLDERLKTERWFPVLGLLEQGPGAPTAEMLIDKVQVNAELPTSLFRPEIPDGVVLADNTSMGRGRLAMKGHEFLEDVSIDDLTRQSKNALGTASSQTWLYILLGNALIVVLLLGIYGVRTRFLKRPT